jgi:hypothetical protein
MTAAPPVIRIRGLSKSYQRGEQDIPCCWASTSTCEPATSSR